jgi:polyisoprenoid-binding protein YceI
MPLICSMFPLLLIWITWLSQPGQLSPDQHTSKIEFEIRNLGLTVTGSLKGLEGKIEFNPTDLKKSFVQLRVQSNSIETGIALRDRHLLKEEYLDADQFPAIQFTSEQIVHTNGNDFEAEGTLVLKGKMKAITIPFSVLRANGRCEFNGKFQLNRHDFDIGENAFTLSDVLTVKFLIVTESTELSSAAKNELRK